MQINIVHEALPGAWLLRPTIFQDLRGCFVKTYHSEVFASLGLTFAPREEFFSKSARGVIRGMHFQAPPHDCDRLVYCIHGRILDVILDLRGGSPTFGKSASAELSAENRLLLLIPKGFAHGFLSLEDNSTTVYLAGSMHVPSHDQGILWNSFGFAWPVTNPVLSVRDETLVDFKEWATPFT